MQFQSFRLNYEKSPQYSCEAIHIIELLFRIDENQGKFLEGNVRRGVAA